MYYFLPAIVFIGIITSYEDIRYGKIRNKWILASIFFALMVYLLLFIHNQVSGKEILFFLINFSIAILFSFALWSFKFWSAGDGKLFIAYSALIPLSIYRSSFMSFFPSFNLFVNTIFPFFIYILVKSIFKIQFRSIKKSFCKNIKSFPELLVSLFSVSWVAHLFGSKFLTLGNVPYSFVIYIGVYYIINIAIAFLLRKLKIKIIKAIHIYIALIVLRFIIEPQNVLNLNLFCSVLISAVLYSLLFRTAYDIVYEKSCKKIEISKLKKGDVVLKTKNRKKTDKKTIFDFIEIKQEGIDEKDIKNISKLCKSGLQVRKVPVAETVAFAPAMFIGVIITLIFGNLVNIIYLLINILRLLGGLF